MKNFDLQGHRGCRGLMPENTIAAFLKAVDLGVNTLEMDVVITKGNEVLVSHEPFMNSEFCLDQQGNLIPFEDERKLNIYQMDMSEIVNFDCGTKLHPRFPEQRKMSATKPLLSDVFDAIESYTAQMGLAPMRYNIEIKSEVELDNIYQPEPTTFSDLVYGVVDKHVTWDRVTIQSFDFRILQYYHKFYPDVTLAVLVENNDGVERNLSTLGFLPQIYSCDYTLMTERDVKALHSKKMKVIPWTVNDVPDMKRMLKWRVDGLITDYPNRFLDIKD
jgi:glycerophosphoryl diester phosphodiesterase